ncbi:MAG: antitoxin [Deltaproteobacteria bacterium]|nr:antitoxin [Deltaproteobacteria bacterium]
MNNIKLDKDEQEILKSFEQGEWKSVQNVKEEKMKHRQYARNTLKKDKRVNIRISSKVLEEIQALAVENGIPYQTLMSSVLHRYVSGYLIEKPRPNKTLERDWAGARHSGKATF